MDAAAVEAARHQNAAGLDAEGSSGEVEPSAGGGPLRFSFPAIRKQFLASEAVRKRLKLEDRKLGEVVYSSGDSEEEAYEREGPPSTASWLPRST